MSLTPPSQAGHADDWIGITDRPLPLGEAASWPVIARCGAVALFAGTVRDHSEGRPGVLSLEYEAYEEHALSRLRGIAAEARRRWPEAGRLVLLHRTGKLLVEEVSVVTAASAPPAIIASASPCRIMRTESPMELALVAQAVAVAEIGPLAP